MTRSAFHASLLPLLASLPLSLARAQAAAQSGLGAQAGGASAPSGAGAQGGAGAQSGAGPQGGAREAMWPAPTEEDWKKPCLVQFQRSWDDALAVAKETGKPILVCVNMDGEIASEHYAGLRYREPEKAALYD